MIGGAVDVENDPTLDLIQPFQLERANVRGRAVRLGPVLGEVLGRHDYPPQVERILAEAITIAVMLASLLKYEGVFTLQTKSDGPIKLLVADVTTAGAVRAYARFDADELPSSGALADADVLLGKGYLAFTVDQGENTDRYQGIVALTGSSLTDCLAHYFEQSEQLLTVVKPAKEDYEDWRRATILMGTAAEVELLDRTLDLNNLLFRLFHEEQVRVFPPTAVNRGCRCSESRVRRVLRSLPRAELDDMKQDGEVSVKCEFCSETYRFDEAELDRLFAGPAL